MGKYERTCILLVAAFVTVLALIYREITLSPELNRPTAGERAIDPRILTEEEKDNHGLDDVEQDYGVSINTDTGKKCSTYDPAKGNPKDDEWDYTASEFYTVYGACPTDSRRRPGPASNH